MSTLIPIAGMLKSSNARLRANPLESDKINIDIFVTQYHLPFSAFGVLGLWVGYNSTCVVGAGWFKSGVALVCIYYAIPSAVYRVVCCFVELDGLGACEFVSQMFILIKFQNIDVLYYQPSDFSTCLERCFF